MIANNYGLAPFHLRHAPTGHGGPVLGVQGRYKDLLRLASTSVYETWVQASTNRHLRRDLEGEHPKDQDPRERDTQSSPKGLYSTA